MELTISETSRRREKQIAYNTKNNITPKQIVKKIDNALLNNQGTSYSTIDENIAAEQDLTYLTKGEIEKRINQKRKEMEAAAKNLDFLVAAKLRDQIKELKNKLS
jgi:excinuclease ABC subunit B